MSPIENLGALALDLGRGTRDLARITGQTLARLTRGRDVVAHMYQIGNRSVIFVAVTLGFLGMVLVFQSCLQLNRVTGDLSPVGPQFLKALTHEFGPTITAMMLATRVGAGIAAEVGSMVVTEQVDALRMCAVDPVEYLIVPRVVASLIMTVVLTTLGVVVALLLGMMTAKLSFRVNPHVFLDARYVRLGDLAIGLTKCAVYGFAIPIVSGTCGLAAKGGSEGVGTATTRAVIGSSFAVLVLDLLVSSFGYLFVQTGPR